MPAGKTTKKKSNQNKSSTPAATQSVHDITVRDCLVWPDDNKKKQQATGTNENVVYVSLRQQQQQQMCQSSSQVQQVRAPAELADDGTVGDALRGWPRYRKQCEEEQQKTDDNVDNDKQKQLASKTKRAQSNKDSKSNKTKSSNRTKEKDEDLHVADLISQRFLHEYMEQREAEMERERKKKEARERAAREGRRAAKDRTDIKANKAAQLRAISLADRVETNPFDLWKMEKFTRSARPHVSTFRNGQGPSGTTTSGGAADERRDRRTGKRGGFGGGGGGGYSGRSSGGGDMHNDDIVDELYGACTCPDQLPYYYERDVYTYNESNDLQALTTDVDNFGDVGGVYNYVETSHQSPSPISAM